METNNNNKYGKLLDKYMDDRHVNYETKMERETEAKDRYGSLLDNVNRIIKFLTIYLMSVMRVEIYSGKERTNTNRKI